MPRFFLAGFQKKKESKWKEIYYWTEGAKRKSRVADSTWPQYLFKNLVKRYTDKGDKTP